MSNDELTRAVEERMSKHAAVGVSERQIAKALAEDFENSNIGAADAATRAEDESFYEGLPMHEDATDPTNAKKDTARRDAILAALDENSKQANTIRSTQRAEEVKAASCPPGQAVVDDTSTPEASVSQDASVVQDTSADQQPPKPPDDKAQLRIAFIEECRQSVVGILAEIRQWQSIPGGSAAAKCKYIVSRGNRFMVIMGFLLFVLLIVALIKFFVKQ